MVPLKPSRLSELVYRISGGCQNLRILTCHISRTNSPLACRYGLCLISRGGEVDLQCTSDVPFESEPDPRSLFEYLQDVRTAPFRIRYYRSHTRKIRHRLQRQPKQVEFVCRRNRCLWGGQPKYGVPEYVRDSEATPPPLPLGHLSPEALR